jgi:DNA transposition AAA+ family ATPase
MSDDSLSGFVETREHRRFGEFCDACTRNRYIGLCYGPPGVGKTLSARHYSLWYKVQACENLNTRTRSMMRAASRCTTVFYTTPVVNVPSSLQRDIQYRRSFLQKLSLELIRGRETDRMERLWRRADELRDCAKNPGGYRGEEAMQAEAAFEAQREKVIKLSKPDPTTLLIVDEADRLKMASLEQVRDVFDCGGIGLVLVGMPGIEKRLSRYPQLYSRVGFVHEFRPLDETETRRLLQGQQHILGIALPVGALNNEEAIGAILRVTGGNFRLLNRLLTQIVRIVEINGLDRVTAAVVESARESLVIGLAT